MWVWMSPAREIEQFRTILVLHICPESYPLMMMDDEHAHVYFSTHYNDDGMTLQYDYRGGLRTAD